MRLKLLVAVILFSPAAPAAAQPADVQFVGDTFSTDLPLVESKEAVHRVLLKCRLADGGLGTLTLDPNVPKFDEFGDPVAGGKPSPLVTLDCTLKLIKKEKERQLHEIRGPKIVSRLSLVVYEDITPWGDGRLLVHGKGGEVRYVSNLSLPERRPKPGQPGGFPAPPNEPPQLWLAMASQQDGKVDIQIAKPEERGGADGLGGIEPGIKSLPATMVMKWSNLRKVTLGKTVHAFRVTGERAEPNAVLKALAKPKGVAVFVRTKQSDPTKPDWFYLALLREDTMVLVVSEKDIYPQEP